MVSRGATWPQPGPLKVAVETATDGMQTWEANLWTGSRAAICPPLPHTASVLLLGQDPAPEAGGVYMPIRACHSKLTAALHSVGHLSRASAQPCMNLVSSPSWVAQLQPLWPGWQQGGGGLGGVGSSPGHAPQASEATLPASAIQTVPGAWFLIILMEFLSHNLFLQAEQHSASCFCWGQPSQDAFPRKTPGVCADTVSPAQHPRWASALLWYC